MAVIAGKVAPRFMGAYNSSTTYQFYDAVTYNNKLYFCKASGTVGKTPSGATDNNWFLSLDGTFTDASSLGGKSASEYALTADLANYLPKTGGYMESSSATDVTFGIKNSLRDIYHRVYADGSYYLRDRTNSKNIFQSTADGTNTFNGTASGNVPLSGGTLAKDAVIDFTKADDSELSANIAIGTGTNSFGIWERGGANRGISLDLRECASWNGSKFLHTGNSAKVVVSSTAPTDTTSAWLDTANKKTKAYIDGAWTVIA